MVEMNSNGLVQFFQIIKKGYMYIITTGRDFVISIFEYIKKKLKSIR